MIFLSACLLFFLWTYGEAQLIPGKARTADGDYNNVNTDGSFDFGYANKDRGSSYHLARAGPGPGAVGGRFGSRDPASGLLKETVYTAGRRGFRARGPNIHRKMDLDQRPRGPIGSKDDPYFDPYEDPSYSFKQKTSTYSKQEDADSRGDVKGHYSYLDDIGERHNVEYIAGKDTGFHVKTPFPDSNRLSIGPLYYNGPLVRGEKKARGHTAIQRGLDGSYRFIAAGPDQRRSESSDAHGNVRGSYSYLDDKGVQRTVHYIAGPGIGYRIVKNSHDPYIPSYFNNLPDAREPDFSQPIGPSAGVGVSGHEDVFTETGGSAAAGHVKPRPNNAGAGRKGGAHGKGDDNDDDALNEDGDEYGSDSESNYGSTTSRPRSGSRRPFVPLSPVRPHGGATGANKYGGGYRDMDNNPDDPSLDSSMGAGGGGARGVVGYGGSRGGAGYSGSGKPPTTIIRNIGDEYLGVPPGVSVRAHVQSIDLYPFGAKIVSPSEAIEKERNIIE